MSWRPPFDRRRRALLSAAAAAAALGLGGAAAVGGVKGPAWLTKRWIERLVRDSLPGVAIDPASLAAFAVEAAHAHPVLRTRERHRDTALRQLFGTGDRGDAQQQLEREIVSWFLTGSDFFRRPPGSTAAVVYAGPLGACANPFATFRDDAWVVGG